MPYVAPAGNFGSAGATAVVVLHEAPSGNFCVLDRQPLECRVSTLLLLLWRGVTNHRPPDESPEPHQAHIAPESCGMSEGRAYSPASVRDALHGIGDAFFVHRLSFVRMRKIAFSF